MAALDRDNCIKFFRLEEDNEDCENVVIIPARKNILQTMFDSEYDSPKDCQNSFQNSEFSDIVFPDEGINLLVKFRHELEDLFRDCGEVLGIAAVLWEDISRRLFEWGFTITGKQCSAKWEALWSEYFEIAQTDDEGRVTGSKHFKDFEDLYELRSKYIDSKIVEDITEYLNSRSQTPIIVNKTQTSISTADVKSERTNSYYESPTNVIVNEDFSISSNDPEESQMLMEAINAAEKILEENLKESDNKDKDGNNPDAKEAPKARQDDRNTSVPKNSLSKTLIDHPVEIVKRRGSEDAPEYQIFVRSTKDNFYWDADSTQCFLDLRLYLETDKEIKLKVLKNYRTIVSFVSQKMLLNGYRVSESDCKKKWDQLMRFYNTEVKTEKRLSTENCAQGMRKYFWQMDNVFKKYKLREITDNVENFCWDDNSIKKLIEIRIPMENAFAMFKRYVILWQYVASQMAKNKYTPTYNECSIKWMGLCEMYKICSDSVQRGAKEKHLNWKFYHPMRLGFEKNIQSTEAIVNYKCDNDGTENEENIVKEVEDKFIMNLTPSTTISRCETDCETLGSNGTSSDNFEEGNGQDLAITEIEQGSNSSESTNNRAEIRELPQGERSVKTQSETLKHLDSLKIVNDLLIEPVILCNKMSQTVTEGEVNACEREDDDSESKTKVKWTEESTGLLIKLKLSRELRFRNPSIGDLELWKEIAEDMRSAGHNACYATCANHWMELQAAYEGINLNEENKLIIEPEYREELKLMELSFAKEVSAVKSLHKVKSLKDLNARAKISKLEWTDEALKDLLALKFSRELVNIKKYGSPLATKMQAAGYLGITALDVTRKWSRLYRTYRKSLFRKSIGEQVKWQYFELVDKHMNGILPPGQEPLALSEVQPFLWTTNAVEKLINTKLSTENSYQPMDRKRSLLIWKKIADEMMRNGFQVTKHDCSIEWNFLVEAYKKTKRELCGGNGAVIGKYFVMMEQALETIKKSNKKVGPDPEEPLDFSTKRINNEPENCGENRTEAEKISESEEQRAVQTQNQGIQTIDENVMNLSMKMNDSLSPKCSKESNEQNHVDSSKENVAWIMSQRRLEMYEKNIRKDEGKMLSQKNEIPTVENVLNNYQSQYLLMNSLIQDRAVNSTEDIKETKELTEKWSESATRLLIDLKLQHNQKFPNSPRPEMSWENVAAELAKLRYSYSPIECCEKWISLKNIYEEKIKDIKEKGCCPQTWLYFQQIDFIYKKETNFNAACRSMLPKKRPIEDINMEDIIPRKKFILPT